MAEYIERDRAIDALDALCDRVCEYKKEHRAVMCGACPLGSAFDTIDILPAADAKAVVHGHWVGIDDEPCDWWECDVCGCVEETEQVRLPHFCPMCGADMRGNDNG